MTPCEEQALDQFKTTSDLTAYAQELERCQQMQSAKMQTGGLKRPKPPMQSAAAKPVQAIEVLPMNPLPTPSKIEVNKDWWAHSLVVVIAIIAVYYYTQKYWSKNTLSKVMIAVVAIGIGYDAKKHLLNQKPPF